MEVGRSVIKVDDLHFSYKNSPVLRGTTFHIGRGEVVGLLGPNGAGKTTIIRLLLGLLQPSRGAIAIDGLDPIKFPRVVKAKIGIVHQTRNFDFDLTVLQNLRIYAALQGMEKGRRDQRIDELAEEFDLRSSMDQVVRTLSGGQQRRVQLARAFMHEPPLIVLDEPTANLDSYWRLQVQEAVKRRAREQKTTVIWTSHDMREIEEATTRILLLQQGRITADDRPQLFARRLSGEYIRLQVASANGWESVNLPGLIHVQRDQEWLVLHVDSAEQRLPEIMRSALAHGLQIDAVRVEPATLERAMLEFNWGNQP